MTTEHTPEPWTEQEATAFAGVLAAFRDSLPPRQQDAFAAILRTAAEAAGDADVQGYFLFQMKTFSESELAAMYGGPSYGSSDLAADLRASLGR